MIGSELRAELPYLLLATIVLVAGVPSALIASMLKVAFGAQNECASDPAEVLSRINAVLH